MIAVAEHWWTFVLRGILAILLGVLMIMFPGMALLTIVILWGCFAIADGAMNIVAALRRPRLEGPARRQPRWALLVQGVLGLAAGAIALLIPSLTLLVLLIVMASWAVATGAMAIIAAIKLRAQIRGEWALILSGLLSIVFGVLLVAFPIAGAFTVALWTAIYMIAFGVLLISVGYRLRRRVRDLDGRHGVRAVPAGA